MRMPIALRSRTGPRTLGLLVVMAAHVALALLVANGPGLRMSR